MSFFDRFKKKAEDVAAGVWRQANPFDGGATYSNPRPQQQAPQRAPQQQAQGSAYIGARPQSRPVVNQSQMSRMLGTNRTNPYANNISNRIQAPKLQVNQPSYGNGLSGAFNQFKDKFDANTPQDRFKRQQAGQPQYAKPVQQTVAGVAKPMAKSFAKPFQQFGNMVVEGNRSAYVDLPKAVVAKATGNQKALNNVASGIDKRMRGQGAFRGGMPGGFNSLNQGSKGFVQDPQKIKSAVGVGAQIGTSVAPIGKSYTLGKQVFSQPIKQTGKTLLKASGANAVLSAGGSAGMQLNDTGRINPKQLVTDTAIGTGIGTVAPFLGGALSKRPKAPAPVRPTQALIPTRPRANLNNIEDLRALSSVLVNDTNVSPKVQTNILNDGLSATRKLGIPMPVGSRNQFNNVVDFLENYDNPKGLNQQGSIPNPLLAFDKLKNKLNGSALDTTVKPATPENVYGVNALEKLGKKLKMNQKGAIPLDPKNNPLGKGAPIEKTDLLAEASKYKTADEFRKSLIYNDDIILHQTGKNTADKIKTEGFKAGKETGLGEKRGEVYGMTAYDWNEHGKFSKDTYARDGSGVAEIAIDTKGLKIADRTKQKFTDEEYVKGVHKQIPDGYDGVKVGYGNGINEVLLKPEVANARRFNIDDFYNQAKSGAPIEKPSRIVPDTQTRAFALLDGDFEGAGYRNHNGIWVDNAIDDTITNKLTPELSTKLKAQGVTVIEKSPTETGVQYGTKVVGNKRHNVIKLTDEKSFTNTTRLDDIFLHESGHGIWFEKMSQEDRDLFTRLNTEKSHTQAAHAHAGRPQGDEASESFSDYVAYAVDGQNDKIPANVRPIVEKYVTIPTSGAPIEKTPQVLTPQEEIQRIHNMAYRRGDKYTLTEEKRLAELNEQIQTESKLNPTESELNRTKSDKIGFNDTNTTVKNQPGTYVEKELADKLNEDLSGKKVTITDDSGTYTGKIKSNRGGEVRKFIITQEYGGKTEVLDQYMNDGGRVFVETEKGTIAINTNNIVKMEILDDNTILNENDLFESIMQKGSGWGKKTSATPVTAPIEKTPTTKNPTVQAVEEAGVKLKTQIAPTIPKRRVVPQIPEAQMSPAMIPPDGTMTKTGGAMEPPKNNGLITAEPATKRKKTQFASETIPNSEFVSAKIKGSIKAPEYNEMTERQGITSAMERLKNDGDEVFEKNVFDNLDKKNGTISRQDAIDAQSYAAILDGGDDAAVRKATQIYEKLSEHYTAAGQLTQAAAMMARRSPEGLRSYATKTLKNNGVKMTPQLEKKLVALVKRVREASPEAKPRAQWEVMDFIAKNVPTSTGDKIINTWRAGLLTAPTTTGGNLLGNSGEMAVRKGFVNPVATAADAVMGAFTGKRTMSLAKAGSGTKGFTEGGKMLPDYLKTGYDPRNNATKYDAPSRINTGSKALDTYINGTYRMMGVADMPFSLSAEKEALSSIARAEAINKGLKGKSRADFVQGFMDNPPETALARAQKEADYATFKNPTALGKAATGLKRPLGPVGDFIVPFTQVPASIATRIVERTPIGTATEMIRQIKNVKEGGAFDQRAMSQAIGNGAFGPAIMGIGYSLANSDLLTYGYPKDDKERKLWDSEGKQPYSVKVGDRWYSLNYLQPFGTLLAIGGQANKAKKEGKDISSIIGQGAATAGQSIMNQSFLKGVGGALDAISDPERSVRQYVENTTSSVVPNFVRSFARASDPKQRAPEGVVEGVKSGIPGLRETTAAKKDMFGQDLPAKDTFANQYLNPLKPSKVRGNEIVAEIRRLKDAGLGTVPTESNKNVFGKTPLTTKELNDLNATIGKKVGDSWTSLINSPNYKALPDEDKKKVLDTVKKDHAAIAKAEWAAKNNKISDEWQPKLTAKQKAIASGDSTASDKDIKEKVVRSKYSQEVQDFSKLSNAEKNAYFRRDPTKAKQLYDQAKQMDGELGKKTSTKTTKTTAKKSTGGRKVAKGKSTKGRKAPRGAMPKFATITKAKKLNLRVSKVKYAPVNKVSFKKKNTIKSVAKNKKIA